VISDVNLPLGIANTLPVDRSRGPEQWGSLSVVFGASTSKRQSAPNPFHSILKIAESLTFKSRSSLNGYRNGLNGQIVCSTAEEPVAFTSFCSEIQNELAPANL
jgi:hypothetical protein